MHDMCDTSEMCETRKSRSSRGRRASARDLCMRVVWGAPRPEALRAWKRVTLQVITRKRESRISSARSFVNGRVIGQPDFESRVITFRRDCSSAVESIYCDSCD